MRVAIVVTVYRNPPRLAALWDNMRWSGLPDIPVYVFEDPSPFEDRKEITEAYHAVASDKGIQVLNTAPQWGCMQGIIQYALENTSEDWIIYFPDDVLFTKGALWNEYAGVLTYGRDFVGAIQAPYWNAQDLVHMGAIPYKEIMLNGWRPDSIPQNPHWNGGGVPRKYINVNGAGFSVNRACWEGMRGWPSVTWRLDEYLGYQSWRQGLVVLTLPGQPRIHFFGGSTAYQPQYLTYHTEESWKLATGGLSPADCGSILVKIMDKLPDENFDGILDFFNKGGSLL